MSQKDAKKPTVLVVDDDEGMRNVLLRILQRRGFTTFAAESGSKAIALFTQFNEIPKFRVDVVVTDFHMPGMNGGQLIAGLRAIRSSLPAILMSGAITTDEFADVGELTAFLRKPFDPDALVAALNGIVLP